MKVGLFLMTQKGFDVISALANENRTESIGFVCIGKDTDVENDYAVEIEDLCRENNIVFFNRSDAPNNKIETDYNIAISWRWMLPVEKLIVLHDSLLPKYRGFAPLVNALINGEKEMGVTAIFASGEYDKGAIILQKKIEAAYPLKIIDAISLIGNLYGEMVIALFDQFHSGKPIQGTPQLENEATYSLWLDDEDYLINWSDSAERIVRKIDSCGYPYTGAKTLYEGQTIRIDEATVVSDVKIENRTPGKHIFKDDGFPVIVCGEGLVKIMRAVYTATNESVFPIKKFRFRLK